MKKNIIKKASNTLRLHQLKSAISTLRANYQVPYCLYRDVMKLTTNDSEMFVRWLMSVAEQVTRVRGFYKKYPLDENEIQNKYEHEKERLFIKVGN